MKRIITSLFLSLFLITSTAFAAWDLPFNGNALFGKSNEGNLTASELVEKLDEGIGPGLTSILALLKNVGLVICVCALAFMGIQLIIAPPDKKAQLKAGVTPYLVGLLLLIAGVPIAIYIINIFIKVF